MQGALTFALTVALTRTHHVTMQVTARDAMLQQAELSYAILSLVCTRPGAMDSGVDSRTCLVQSQWIIGADWDLAPRANAQDSGIWMGEWADGRMGALMLIRRMSERVANRKMCVNTSSCILSCPSARALAYPAYHELEVDCSSLSCNCCCILESTHNIAHYSHGGFYLALLAKNGILASMLSLARDSAPIGSRTVFRLHHREKASLYEGQSSGWTRNNTQPGPGIDLRPWTRGAAETGPGIGLRVDQIYARFRYIIPAGLGYWLHPVWTATK